MELLDFETSMFLLLYFKHISLFIIFTDFVLIIINFSAAKLSHVAYRMGILASLRSKLKDGNKTYHVKNILI